MQRYLALHELGCCSLLAGTTFIIFMTLLPLMIDPSILTFVLQLEPAACLTVAAAVLNGMSNCSWSSCQQACTVDIYKCWHVNVSYLLEDPALAAKQLLPPYQTPARLYPNVIGCGYPPDVDCDQFFRLYAAEPAFERTFPCYVSLSDPSVAVVHADRTEAAWRLVLGFTPLILCLGFSLYISLRLRCQRRRARHSQAKGLVPTVDLAAEQARRILESKRLLESRKQSWLKAFRQDRVAAVPTTSQPPPPPIQRRKPPDPPPPLAASPPGPASSGAEGEGEEAGGSSSPFIASISATVHVSSCGRSSVTSPLLPPVGGQ